MIVDRGKEVRGGGGEGIDKTGRIAGGGSGRRRGDRKDGENSGERERQEARVVMSLDIIMASSKTQTKEYIPFFSPGVAELPHGRRVRRVTLPRITSG